MMYAPFELVGLVSSSSSVNGEGSTPKDPMYKMLDELRSLKLWKEKQDETKKIEENIGKW